MGFFALMCGQIPEAHTIALRVIGYIGVSASLVTLTITVVILTSFKYVAMLNYY
jgi:hypothetical protein